VPITKSETGTVSRRPRKTTAAGEPQPPPTPMTAGSPALEEEIRRRAYELYQSRGGQGGTPDEDWYRAEAEVRARLSQRTA
jgi:hypothetical protein